jgi:DNA-binding NarL/FixJ family response regulator
MSIKVFLADDHAVVRDGLRCLLEVQGDIHVIGDAANGREAVRQVRELKPDVVLMDIAMPELNGIEATVQVRHACPEVRVLILSMHSSLEHVREALKAGARGYLLKRCAGVEVVEAVRAVYAEGAYLSQKIAGSLIADYARDPQPNSPLDALTRRERQILQLIVEGKSNFEASQSLFLSQKTVETYRSRMMQKLRVTCLPDLMKFALRHGITTLE